MLCLGLRRKSTRASSKVPHLTQPQTLNPTPCTSPPNPQPSTLDPKPDTAMCDWIFCFFSVFLLRCFLLLRGMCDFQRNYTVKDAGFRVEDDGVGWRVQRLQHSAANGSETLVPTPFPLSPMPYTPNPHPNEKLKLLDYQP